jgi:hypothetical protein
LVLIFIMSLVSVPNSYADEFEPFRRIIDSNEKHSIEEIQKQILLIQKTNGNEVEKLYNLGMLEMIAYFKNAMIIMKQNPKFNPDTLKDNPKLSSHYISAVTAYKEVERLKPGHKRIYCKLVELMAYGFDKKGFSWVTRKIGSSGSSSKDISECKTLVEDRAEMFVNKGLFDISIEIYSAAVETWTPYPEYMLEALGDLEAEKKNRAAANRWLLRCVAEAKNDERKARCIQKSVKLSKNH